MKILYFGTVCDLKEYEAMLSDCKEKASIATIVFESALLSGLKQNGAEVEVLSYPMIPAFPHSKFVKWGNKSQTLPCGYNCTWLKTINIPVLKQLSRRINGRRLLKKWLKNNQGEDLAVLSYSMPPFLTADIIKLTSRYGAKCFTVLTDLLRDMYINSNDNKLLSKLKSKYLSKAINLQGSFDGYIYLTEAMKDVVSPDKPYIVMEGIADTDTFDTSGNVEKARPAAVMYAGMLEEKFGILNLVDAFESVGLPDTQLWIFGSGNAADTVKARSESNPNIVYFGRKDRADILRYEQKASVLVNPRSTEDEFTRYSFPSKTIEYMMSGTPVITTELSGIPKEYFDYLFTAESNSVADLKSAIMYVLSLSDDNKASFGAKAKNFIINNKNAKVQSNRIIEFMTEVFKS